MASSSSDPTLSMGSIFHSIQLKLSSTNYLLLSKQMLHIFELQDLMSHIDETNPTPPTTVTVEGKSIANPLFTAWKNADRKTVILLNASLTQDALSEAVGHETARDKWFALAAAFSNSSTERVQNLQDQLQTITRGTASVADSGRRSKTITDQLAAIGPAFETFSIALRAARHDITLRELQSQAESTEFFTKTIHGNQQPSLAFTAHQQQQYSTNRGI